MRRVSHYGRLIVADRVIERVPFTRFHQDAAGSPFIDDGFPEDVALKLVNKWNTQTVMSAGRPLFIYWIE